MKLSRRNHMSDPIADEAPLWYRHIYPGGQFTGFYHAMKDHALVYVERSPSTLIVTFDNLSQAGGAYLNRDPWAAKFIADEGHSHLGVIANGPTWFRDPQLITYLERLRDEGFFERFPVVAMAGTSMGGFAALTFSHLAPGARVVAFSPQSTLNQDLVPWERRFVKSRLQDWTLPYSDAAADLQNLGKAYVIYDPFDINDARHAARIPPDNVTLLRAPGCGHKTAMVLRRTETLKTVMRTAIDGTLTAESFARLVRGRRNTRIYCLEMIGHFQARKHDDRASQFKWAFNRRRKRIKKEQKNVEVDTNNTNVIAG